MRIGINASFLRKPGTGIGTMTENFLRELGKQEARGENEYILYLEEDADISFLPENFSKRVFLPGWKRDDVPRQWLWQKFSLPAQVRNDRCEAFLSLYQSATVFPRSFRHTMLVHDIIPEIFPEYQGNLRQKLLWAGIRQGIRQASRIVSVSESTKKDLSKLGIPEEKITVAYQSVSSVFSRIPGESETAAVLDKYGLERGYFYHGGGLEIRKNTKSLLLAYQALLEEKGEALPKLVISGKIFPKGNPLAFDIEAAVADLGLRDHVSLLGFVPEADLPALYRGALAFVYPSLYEGFGIPVLEALSLGAPVLVSANSSLPEVGGEAVLYCDPENPKDIAQKLGLLLEDESLRNRLREAGPRQASQFQWSAFVSDISASFRY